MTSSSPETAQELDYPPVRVDQSIERLDLNTLIMRSNARRNPEEAASLDESTYEVVGMSDSVYETSDDEGHTASVASTPDNMSVLTDDEEDGGDDDGFERDFMDGSTQPLEASIADAPDADVATGVDESTLTEAPYMTNSESTREIMMKEQSTEAQDGADAWAVTKEYTPTQAAEGVLKRYGCSEVRLTVRAALSSSHLPARKSFKILYVGTLGQWAKREIDSRIGFALDASPGPSRSIMRDGQMESYGLEIASDHCADIKPIDNTGKAHGVKVTFDDGTRLTFGTQREYSSIESSRVPDMVVFWYPQPKLAAPEIDNFSTAREAFERQGISCLHVAEDRRFHLHTDKTLGIPKSLRVCVEGKKRGSKEFELQETIPVDLYTLLNLDPLQLNRHLAALDPRISPSKSIPGAKRGNHARVAAFKNIMRMFREPQGLTLFTMTVGAFSIIAALYLVPRLYGMEPQAQVEIPMTKPMSISTPVPPPASVTSASAVSTISSVPVKVTPRELTVVSSLQVQMHVPRIVLRRAAKTAGFEIQPVSEHQFVLRPTKDFISRKGKPQLQIHVSRDAESIPIRYTRTMQGAYIVDLEQEYPLGSFNVSIATHSKPLMQQSFAISMGHNKTMVAQLVDFVRRDVAATQQGLKKWSSTLLEHVQSEVVRAKDGTRGLNKQVEEVARRQMASGAALVQGVSANTWTTLRRATAPVRTSNAALRARDNAFQIRCRFEEAVGLSSTNGGGKKSRSCEYVGR